MGWPRDTFEWFVALALVAGAIHAAVYFAFEFGLIGTARMLSP